MTTDVCDVVRFRAIVLQRFGLQFDDGKLAFLSEVLHRRLDVSRRAPDAYLHMLEQGGSREDQDALAQELTVPETYFFRNIEQFRVLSEVALPERLRAREKGGTLRLLSAGCASGEEAYSIAIATDEIASNPAWSVHIRAVDINPAVLAKAAQGRYPAWALRETPPELRHRWFRAEGRDVVLDPALRAKVSFEVGNLAVDDPGLWAPETYDVIFFRNVMMYFSPAHMKAAVTRAAKALAPGGYLFVGHAETLRGLSSEFHLCHTHDTFYYRRKESTGRVIPLPVRTGSWSQPPAPHAPADGWVEAIRGSSERVAALIPAPMPQCAVEVLPQAEWNSARVLDLMVRERFADALADIRAQMPEAFDNTDLVLLEAVLLANLGELDAAESACKRILTADELNAGARYLLALCREQRGDRETALEHNRIATHLDPSFAMPRLHLGLLERRAGDREGARRDLNQALVLLKREDASRLLMFGGGFQREALIALCESALRECGGRP